MNLLVTEMTALRGPRGSCSTPVQVKAFVQSVARAETDRLHAEPCSPLRFRVRYFRYDLIDLKFWLPVRGQPKFGPATRGGIRAHRLNFPDNKRSGSDP